MKAAAAALIASLLGLSLGKDMSLLVYLAAGIMGITAALEFIEPVLDFMQKLITVANMSEDTMQILLKSVGIGLTAEFSSMICSDAGSGSLAKMLRLLATFAVLWLCLPLLQSILTVLQQILGGV